MNLEIEELKNLIPSIIIDHYYNVIGLNSTAQKMLGDVKGEKCYKVLYGFSSPCYQRNIACPVYHKTANIDTINLDFESYLRSYGGIPMGGLFYESFINITKMELIRSAILDPLTNLYNKRFIENFLYKTFSFWKRYSQIFSVIYIDIDNLKEINEEFGHSNGDEAIVKVSSCLKMRASDVVGRLEGDEFLVVLPNTAIKEAEGVAQRIMKCIDEIRFIKKISVSAGVTEALNIDENYREVIERAKTAVYKVKNSHKGKIGITTSEEEISFLEIS